MTQDSHYNLVSKIKPSKIILPVILGLAVIGWFISRDINTEVLSKLIFTWKSVFWLLIAWGCMICRDLGYMIRIRILSDKDLSWRQAFRVIMLWEFTSAITPSTVGGTAVAVVFLHKEGMTVGKSTAVVLATSLLDELYFVIMLPLILLIVGKTALFTTSLQGTGISFLNELVLFSAIGYSIIFMWVILVGYGLFFNPEGIRNLIINIFKLPVLRRWHEAAVRAGNDIVESSHELRKRKFSFWFKAMTATFLSWTARYWVVNAIIVAFFPSPGGSGFAELILGRYISDQIPADPLIAGSIALAIAIIWRIISYYPYLIIGALLVPGWIKRNFVKPITKKK
jgi:uncharacterized membrane protein YbhN (UPF0104 family)